MMDSYIRQYCKAHEGEDFFFVQIGANDGKSGDPIYTYIKEYHWKGILIEPVPFLFKKLLKTYEGTKGLSFENVAISDTDGIRPFYRIARKTEPEKEYWFDQLGSFKKEVVESHWNNIPEKDKHFVTEDVPTMSFSTLISKYAIRKIDLLHIDTEGYDFEIIKLIPFSKVKPNMIFYEHRHLSEKDKADCVRFLSGHGYKLEIMEFDVFAYLL